jgi:hypothetical protein
LAFRTKNNKKIKIKNTNTQLGLGINRNIIILGRLLKVCKRRGNLNFLRIVPMNIV